MQLVTTISKPKPFTWSYSKLKNFETCPKRHLHCDILKDVKEPESEQLLWGNLVHSALAARVKDGKPLPRAMEKYEDWCDKMVSTPGELLVEQKLAINKDFGPTTYFSDDVWFRAVGDVIKLNGRVALVADWKTGKILEDGSQLALAAQCVFAHYEEVQAVRSEFIWLKEDATTSAIFKRCEMSRVWDGLWPRIRTLEHAAEINSYPPKPGGLCKRYCPVVQCPHNGANQ
jgi:hypothetical protein